MAISIPLYIFLFAYLAFLVVFAIFFVFNIIHLMHTGGTTLASFFVTVVIFALSAFTIYFSFALTAAADWRSTVDFRFATQINNNY